MTIHWYKPHIDAEGKEYWWNTTDTTDTARGHLVCTGGKRLMKVIKNGQTLFGKHYHQNGARRYWLEAGVPPGPPIGPNCVPTDGKIPWILQFKGVSFYYVSSGNYYAFASGGLGRAENSSSTCCTNVFGNPVRNGGVTRRRTESIIVSWTPCVDPSDVRASGFRYGYLDIKNTLSFPTYEMISKYSSFEAGLKQDNTGYEFTPTGNNKIVTVTTTCDGDPPCPWNEGDAGYCPGTSSDVPTSPTTGVPTISAWLEPFSVTLTAVESIVSCSHVIKTLKLSYYSAATGNLLSEVTLPLP